MTKQTDPAMDAGDRPVLEIEITPAMIEAGEAALDRLTGTSLEGCPYSTELLVEELLLASLSVSSVHRRRTETANAT